MSNGANRAIVIGTGAGGLVAAGFLAKSGFEVLGLERARELGGYINPFQRKGYHFDPGVHYMGECAPGGMVYNVLKGLDLDVEDMFCEMDPAGCDVYRFPDMEVRLCKGREAFRAHLTELFPRQERAIERFFKVLGSFAEIMRVMSRMMRGSARFGDLRVAPHLLPAFRWAFRPYKSFLEWVTDDPRLRAAMCGPLGAIGLPPSQVSSLMGMGMFLHFIEGGYFPKGGSGQMRDTLVDAAKAHGAVFRTKADVKQIVLEDGVATGVVLLGGELIEADVVVSAVEPTLTYGELIHTSALPWKLRLQVARTKPSLGSFYCFLGLKRDLSQHGLGPYNLWDFPTYDMEEVFRPSLEGRMGDRWSLIASPNSLKDTSGKLAPKGCSTLEVMTLAPYEPFARWDGLPSFQRGPEYTDLKNRLGEQILDYFDRRNPGIIGDIEVKEFATPVSNSYWVNAVRGGAYGPAMSILQTGPFRYTPTTPFRNLFLAGSGVFGCGVASCFLSGQVAAAKASKAMRE